MAFIQLHFFSEELGMQTEVEIVFPQRNSLGEIGINNHSRGEELKCLYLLHGLSDDQTIWMRRTSIERYAGEYGICVIMPFGGRSFYFNQNNGEKYYSYIAKELPTRINEFLGIPNKRENKFVAGLSMGGYGALKIALKENDCFCAAAGLSSVADIKTTIFKKHIEGIIGKDNYISDEEDLFYLVREKSLSSLRPRLYMWCGTEDSLYQDNVKLKDHIQKFNYDYTYKEGPGKHCWEIWDEEINNILRWMFE